MSIQSFFVFNLQTKMNCLQSVALMMVAMVVSASANGYGRGGGGGGWARGAGAGGFRGGSGISGSIGGAISARLGGEQMIRLSMIKELHL
jgi:hypothetical protein